MVSRVFSSILGLIGVAVATTGPALAQRGHDQGALSLDRILPEIRSHHPGRFFDAEGPWPGPDGRQRYRIKWMTPDGRIIWFETDAITGRELGGDTYPRQFDAPSREGGHDDTRRHFDGSGGPTPWRGGNHNENDGHDNRGGNDRGGNHGLWQGGGRSRHDGNPQR